MQCICLFSILKWDNATTQSSITRTPLIIYYHRTIFMPIHVTDGTLLVPKEPQLLESTLFCSPCQ